MNYLEGWRRSIEERLLSAAATAVKLAARVARLESMLSQLSARPASSGGGSAGGVVRAKVTTAIPAASWTSLSSTGRAQIRLKDAGGTWVDAGDPVVVWNDQSFCPGTTSIAVNKVVKLVMIDYEWWLLGADS